MSIQSIRLQRYDYETSTIQSVEYVKVDNIWKSYEGKFLHWEFMPSLAVFV